MNPFRRAVRIFYWCAVAATAQATSACSSQSPPTAVDRAGAGAGGVTPFNTGGGGAGMNDGSGGTQTGAGGSQTGSGGTQTGAGGTQTSAGGAQTGAGGSQAGAGTTFMCAAGDSKLHVVGGSGVGTAARTIQLDGASRGRAFDGIGAVSGGGGNTRLLFDYPEPQRAEVLDYLFKPGYGAALQILKAEIGGDTQSTDGAEPSHMHSAKDLDCTRGYEWWLMSEARARNPQIKLYGLSWGAPGWIGGGTFWSNDNIDYHIAWLKCAKAHGLAIDYLGGWNEKGYSKSWYARLHAAIVANGFATKLVGADTTSWGIADDMSTDAAFAGIVDVIGVHYPCGYHGAEKDCHSTANAVASAKPLWASETGSEDYDKGGQAMARAQNRLYLDASITGALNWPLISAMVPNLSWEHTGLAVADQPWSGWYDLGLQLWITAQTTQFAQPGWQYLDTASGYFTPDKSSGSYVTLKSPGGADYSVVIETIDAKSPQTIAFHAQGGLSTADVHVWSTDLGSKNTNDYFVPGGSFTLQGGSYWLTLEPNRVYSVTTTTGQCKGTTNIPGTQTSQPLPYQESFEGYAPASEAHLISDMEGSFEVTPCAGGRGGQCYRQMSPTRPIAWASAGAGTPFTLLGTADWADYQISADVLLEAPGSAELIGRFTAFSYGRDWEVSAYYLSLSDSGAWSLYSNNRDDGTHRVLSSGKVAALGVNSWHQLALAMKGTTLTAIVDGTTVGSTQDATWKAGPAGVAVGSGSNTWLNAQFDNLSVSKL